MAYQFVPGAELKVKCYNNLIGLLQMCESRPQQNQVISISLFARYESNRMVYKFVDMVVHCQFVIDKRTKVSNNR